MNLSRAKRCWEERPNFLGRGVVHCRGCGLGASSADNSIVADAMIGWVRLMLAVRYFVAAALWVTLVTPVLGAGHHKKPQTARKIDRDILAILDDPESAHGF
jgi:hypothetical protein